MKHGVLLLALLGLFSPQRGQAAGWRSGADGYDAALREQRANGAPILLYFHTAWCGYCKALDREVLANGKVKAFLDPFAKVKVNPEESADNEELSQRFGVTGYPTVLVGAAGKEPVAIPASRDAGPDAFIAMVKRVTGDIAVGPDTRDGSGSDDRPAAPAVKVDLPAAVLAALPDDIVEQAGQGRYAQAISALGKEIARAEKSGAKAAPALYYARAAYERAIRRHASAAADFQTWLEAHPDDATARELLARSYLNVKMFQEAAEELEPLVQDNPSAERYFLLGEADSRRGREKEARKAYATACKLGYKAACR